MSGPNFNFLLNASQEHGDERKERSMTAMVVRLLKGLGLPMRDIEKLERDNGGQLNWGWFGQTFAYPIQFQSTEIKTVNVQDMFERPTKSDVYGEFRRLASLYDDKNRYFAVLVRVKGFSTLVISDSSEIGHAVRTCIRFGVGGYYYYITLFKELMDACRERWPLQSLDA